MVQQLRDAIRAFDADYDIPQRYAEFLAICPAVPSLLTASPQPFAADVVPPGADAMGLIVEDGACYYVMDGAEPAGSEVLSLLVGAAWCHMIMADVEHNLAAGMQAIEHSLPAAEALLQRIDAADSESANQGGGVSESNAIDPFWRYVSARWRDGAAKLYYRCGDHTQGRFYLEQARRLAQHPALWSCRADIESDYIRNAYQESAAGVERVAATRLDEYLRAVGCWVHVGVERLEEVMAALAGGSGLEGAVQNLTAPGREHLRGLCNLFHNLSVACKSAAYSRTALRIAEALGDRYRIAQARHQQALWIWQNKPHEAKRIWEEIQHQGRWGRGAWFARQWLAKPEIHGNQSAAAYLQTASDLFGLVDAIQSRYAGARVGKDVELHRWTVEAAAGALKTACEKYALDNQQQQTAADLKRRLRSERLEAARAELQVVKVSMYKHSFIDYYGPIFQQLIGEDLESVPPNPSRALALAEEWSSRELFDLLANQKQAEAKSSHDGSDSASSTGIISPANTLDIGSTPDGPPPAADDDQLRLAGAEPSAHSDPWLFQQVVASQRRFEEDALARPMPTAAANEQIADQLMEYARAHRRLALIRFVHYRRTAADKQPLLGAFVLHDGKLQFTPSLQAEKSLALMKEIHELPWGRSPIERRRFRSRRFELFDRLAKTLAQDLLEKPLAALPPDVLRQATIVLIPSQELFGLPLHLATVAWDDGQRPLAAARPVAYCTSGQTLLLRHPRGLPLAYSPPGDVLCSLLAPDKSGHLELGREILEANWAREAHFLSGPAAALEKTSATPAGDGDPASLAELVARDPTLLYIAAHGAVFENVRDATPYLDFPCHRAILTPYDLSRLPAMRRNQLTILASCLSGAAASKCGSEISGFVRGLMAAGAGALMLTGWRVWDEFTTYVAGRMLATFRDSDGRFSLIDALHQIYAGLGKSGRRPPGEWSEYCMFSLYI